MKLVDVFKSILKTAPRGPGSRKSSIFSIPKNITSQTSEKINAYLLNEENKEL